MKENSEKIVLSRKEGNFQAAIALVEGELNELSLCLDRLHPKEIKRYKTFCYDLRKVSYLLGRFSAKQAIMHLTENIHPSAICIDSGVFEFPIVQCPLINNIHVSISHCDSIGLSLAFEDSHPMGIDIEKIESTNKRAMQSQITTKEKTLLKNINLNNLQGYASLWSVKESLSKVLKTGMMLDFSLLETKTIVQENGLLTSTFVYFGQYKAISYVLGKYVISITLPKNSEFSMHRVRQWFSFLNSTKDKS